MKQRFRLNPMAKVAAKAPGEGNWLGLNFSTSDSHSLSTRFAKIRSFGVLGILLNFGVLGILLNFDLGLKKEKKKEVHQERGAVSAGTGNLSFTRILNGKRLDLLQ